MFIVISNLRKKLLFLGKILFVLVVLGVVVYGMVSLINFYKPDIANWLKKESQVVGPMRTEPSVKTWFDQTLDQYVIKLQDFYYEEKE